METRIDEIADRVYRLSTFVAAAGPPAGFTFNQFLIDAEEPLLFHCGQRSLFPASPRRRPGFSISAVCGGSRSATSRRTSPAR